MKDTRRQLRKPRAQDVHPASWLPGDANPCVWMAAGLVSYKLCERDYDCEHCPLDAALAGDGGKRPATGSSPARDWRARCEFRPDRHYHASHGWVQRLHGSRLRYGLDMFAGHLLDRVTSVVLPPIGSRLRRGQPGCWIVDGGETLPFRAPVSGTVVGVNPGPQQEPALLGSSPYDDGWLFDLRCDTELEAQPGLMCVDDMREHTERQLEKLHEIESRTRARDPRVGATLKDGGRPIVGLRGMLGARRYGRLIRELLG